MFALILLVFSISDTLKLMFMGDIMQHGPQVSVALVDSANPADPASYNYYDCFKHLEGRLANTDLCFANIETSFGGYPYSGYPTFSSPTSLLDYVYQAGVNVFLTANNHICDRGAKGLKNSIEKYTALTTKSLHTKRRAYYTGIYTDEEDEYKNNPLIINEKNIKIAVINVTYGTNGIQIPNPYIVNLINLNQIRETIKKAKQAKADVIIVCPHWGEEYMLFSNQFQKSIADSLINMGTDIIIGGHPHVPEEIEYRYQDTVIKNIIAYSLGNVISNQSTPYTQIGILYSFSIIKDSLTEQVLIADKNKEYIWCSRAGKYEKNYTVLPIKDVIGKKYEFQDKEDYDKMILYLNKVDSLYK